MVERAASARKMAGNLKRLVLPEATSMLCRLLLILAVLGGTGTWGRACPGCKEGAQMVATEQGESASNDIARPTPLRFDSGLYVMLAGTAAAMAALGAIVAFSQRARR